jgi:Ca2+-binding EF-hand superfamily protein
MLTAAGAASSALDALKSLIPSKQTSPPVTGFAQTNPFDFAGGDVASTGFAAGSGTGGGSQISPQTMSALLAAQSQSATTTSPASGSPSDALKDLFSQIDTNGDGEISKSEFEGALGAGGTNVAQADDVFGKLDSNGDGLVSLGEMSSALKGAGGKGHHHHHQVAGSNGSGDSGSTGASSSDPLTQALDAATTVTNSDGSTTTSMTLADGTTVTMTQPAATTASSTATSSYNFIEQMIQREAQAISSSAAASLSVSA